jgi:hypothetical protein
MKKNQVEAEILKIEKQMEAVTGKDHTKARMLAAVIKEQSQNFIYFHVGNGTKIFTNSKYLRNIH